MNTTALITLFVILFGFLGMFRLARYLAERDDKE